MKKAAVAGGSRRLSFALPPSRGVPTFLFVVVRQMRVGRLRFGHRVRPPLIADHSSLLFGGSGLFLGVLFFIALALGGIRRVFGTWLGGGFLGGVFEQRLVFGIGQVEGGFQATVTDDKKGSDGNNHAFNIVDGVPAILLQ